MMNKDTSQSEVPQCALSCEIDQTYGRACKIRMDSYKNKCPDTQEARL